MLPMNRRLCLLPVLLSLTVSGCLSVQVKPIHVTVDVNVKVDQALDNFFGDLDKKSTSINPTKP